MRGPPSAVERNSRSGEYSRLATTGGDHRRIGVRSFDGGDRGATGLTLGDDPGMPRRSLAGHGSPPMDAPTSRPPSRRTPRASRPGRPGGPGKRTRRVRSPVPRRSPSRLRHVAWGPLAFVPATVHSTCRARDADVAAKSAWRRFQMAATQVATLAEPARNRRSVEPAHSATLAARTHALPPTVPCVRAIRRAADAWR